MNPHFLYALTDFQKERYKYQPFQKTEYQRVCMDAHEIFQYLKGTSTRFWYNYQGEPIKPHWHEGIELVIPVEDSYSITVQDRIWQLEPGDILVIPPGEIHAPGYAPSGARFFFQIDLDILDQMKGFPFIRSLLVQPFFISQENCPQIYEKEISLVMKLAEYYWSDSPVKNIHIYAALLEFLACYGDFTLAQDSRDPVPKVKEEEPASRKKLARVFEYIEQHFSEQITLESMAELSGFSKFYFTRVFKECTGKTFYDYLTLRRLQEAERLLLNPNLPVHDISARCGFGTVSAFNRTFKKWNGCSPTDFRGLHGSVVRM